MWWITAPSNAGSSYAQRVEQAFHKNKKRVGIRWLMDETYLKIKGQWRYLYRAVDKQGNNIDFLLTAKRDTKAARRTRPMLGFKSFWSTRATLAGIELWLMLKKGQNKSSMPAWQQFYELALAG